MKSKKIKKKFYIIAALVVSGIIVAIYGMYSYNKMQLPNILIASMEDVVVHSEVFTTKKLIRQSEENVGFDSSVQGTFLLTKEEVEKLLETPYLLKCPPGKECHIERSGDRFKGEYCNWFGTGAQEGRDYELCVNRQNSQATWRTGWN